MSTNKRTTPVANLNQGSGTKSKRKTKSVSNKDGAKKSTKNKDKKVAQSIKSSTKSKGKENDDSSMQSNQTKTGSGPTDTDSSSHTGETDKTSKKSNEHTGDTGQTDTESSSPTGEIDRTPDESNKSTEPDPSKSDSDPPKSDSSLTTDTSSKEKTPEKDLEAAVGYVKGFIEDKVFGHEATKLVGSIKTLHKNRVDPANYKKVYGEVVEETEEIFEVTKEVLGQKLFSHLASFKRILEEEGHKPIKDTEGNPIRFKEKDSTEDNVDKKKSERKYSGKKRRKNLMKGEEDNPEEKKKMSNIALKDLKQEGRKLVYFDKDIILFTNNIKDAKDASEKFIQLIAFPNDLKLKSIKSLENTEIHRKLLNELEDLKGKIFKIISKEKSDPELKEKDLHAKFDYYPERYWLNCKFSLESEVKYGKNARNLADVLKDLGKIKEVENADLVVKKRIHLAAMYIHSLAKENNEELDTSKDNLKDFSEQVWKNFEVMRKSLDTEGKEPDYIRNCKYLFLTSMTIYALTKNFNFNNMDFVMRDKLEEVYDVIKKKYSDSVEAEETGSSDGSGDKSAASSEKSEITYI